MAKRERIHKFLTPNTDATELDRFKRSFCIPDDAQWLGVFMGAIYPLTRTDNWELDGIVTPDEAAAVFQTIFDEAFYATGECDDMACCPLRYDESGMVEQYNPETSEYEPIDYPVVPARTPVAGQDTECLAAANATEVMRQLWEAWETTWDNASFMVAVAGIITIIGLLIFYPVAIPLVITFFTELYGLMAAIGADDFDTDKQDILRCILFCHAVTTEGVVTFNFDDVVQEVDDLWTPVTDINVWAGIHYLLLIIGEDGLNRAGTTTSITESTCECEDCPYCYNTDFELTDGDYVSTDVFGRGVWSLGHGWAGTAGGTSNEVVDISRTFDMSNITGLSLRVENQAHAGTRTRVLVNGTALIDQTGGGTLTLNWSGDVDTTVVRIYVVAEPGIDIVVKWITQAGLGANPLGEDNC